MKFILGLLAIAMVGGAIYFFTQSGKASTKSTTTKTDETSNAGLSGLLSGVNLSGVHFFG